LVRYYELFTVDREARQATWLRVIGGPGTFSEKMASSKERDSRSLPAEAGSHTAAERENRAENTA
jgi:hypothetical protein